VTSSSNVAVNLNVGQPHVLVGAALAAVVFYHIGMKLLVAERALPHICKKSGRCLPNFGVLGLELHGEVLSRHLEVCAVLIDQG